MKKLGILVLMISLLAVSVFASSASLRAYDGEITKFEGITSFDPDKPMKVHLNVHHNEARGMDAEGHVGSGSLTMLAYSSEGEKLSVRAKLRNPEVLTDNANTLKVRYDGKQVRRSGIGFVLLEGPVTYTLNKNTGLISLTAGGDFNSKIVNMQANVLR